MKRTGTIQTKSLMELYSQLDEECKLDVLERYKEFKSKLKDNTIPDNQLFIAFLKGLLKKEFKYFTMFFVNLIQAQDFDFALHVKILCEVCQQHSQNNLKYNDDVVINIPPGHSKTTICNILYSAWLLGNRPALRILVRTLSDDLAVSTNNRTADIMQTDLFVSIFGRIVESSTNNNIITRQGTIQGFRSSMSIGSGVTGKDSDFLICFPATQKVMTDIGFLQIGDIVENKIQCKVKAYNEKTKKYKWVKINKYIKNVNKKGFEMVEIELSNGDIVKCTDNHLFLTNRGWLEAKEIKPLDKIVGDKFKTFSSFNISYRAYVCIKSISYFFISSSSIKYIYNLLFGKFRTRHTKRSNFNSIFHIFTLRPVAKVFNSIISRVRVKMSGFHPIRTFTNKSRKDKAMNVKSFYFTIFCKIYNLMSVTISAFFPVITRFKEMFFNCVKTTLSFLRFFGITEISGKNFSFKRFYTSIAPCLIKTNVIRYISVNNVRHIKKEKITYCISTPLHTFIIVNDALHNNKSWLLTHNCDDP